MNLRQKFGKHPLCKVESRNCSEQDSLFLLYLIFSRIILLWIWHFLHVADWTEICLAPMLTTRRHYPLSYQKFSQAAFAVVVPHRKISPKSQLIATTDIFLKCHSQFCELAMAALLVWVCFMCFLIPAPKLEAWLLPRCAITMMTARVQDTW